MNGSLAMTRPNGPEAIAQSLIETLDDERSALSELGAAFNTQLDWLRSTPEPIQEDAVLAASDIMGRLGRLRTARERHMRLLRRVLKLDDEAATIATLTDALAAHPTLHPYSRAVLQARNAVRAEARHTRRSCEELNFALQYAADLGRELMQGMHDQMAPAGPQTYTAAGRTARTASRARLNHVG